MTDTTTITLVIDTEVDQELERLAKETGHTKPDVARDVLADWFQVQQDYRGAAAILARSEPSSTSAEVRRRLGLDGWILDRLKSNFHGSIAHGKGESSTTWMASWSAQATLGNEGVS